MIVGKSCKKIYIFCPTNIPGAMVLLPLALAFGTFGAKRIGRPSDMDQSSSQIVCSGTIGLAIALLSASTVFLVWKAPPRN